MGSIEKLRVSQPADGTPRSIRFEYGITERLLVCSLFHRPHIEPASCFIHLQRELSSDRVKGRREDHESEQGRDTWETVFEEIDANEIDVLLISPERLNNPGFRSNILPGIMNRMGLLVIDEVHCISDWGHDFRPDYRRLERVVSGLPPSTPVLGTTATANDRVIADIAEQMGDGLKIIRGTLDRPSLQLQVIDLPNKAHRLAWLADVIPTLSGSGIVYTLTIADATRTAAFLNSEGTHARSYTGPTDPEDRLEIERLLSDNRLKVVVATSALAMGYDNPHIEFVIHFQIPGSAIAYYQQVGRAGRAVESSYGIALAGAEDKRIQDHFIDTAFPSEEAVESILGALSDHNGLKLNEILRFVNISYQRLEAALNLLDVEGAVYKEESTWFRSAEKWEYPSERFEHVTNERKKEQAAMARYVTSTDCLMQQLRALLDDPSEPCGRCANCAGPALQETPTHATTKRAKEFLGTDKIVIEPRLRPPSGLTSLTLPSCQEGRALSRYNEPGYGELVRVGKYDTHRLGVIPDGAQRDTRAK